MKTIVVIVALVFLGASFVSGQNTNAPITRSLLLEARYRGVGLSGIEGDRLIARIYNDGTIEYDDLRSLNTHPEYYQRTAKLTGKELANLSSFLSSAELASLLASYPAFTSAIDHRTDLTLVFSFRGGVKRVEVENFKPLMDKESKVYPQGLLVLACWAEFARKNAKLSFFFWESSFWCDAMGLCRR